MRKLVLAVMLLLGSTTFVHAQSLKDLLNKENISKAVSTVTGESKSADIIGTWTYTGVAIELESTNVLKKAGGTVAASTVEKKINEQLEKVGLTENSATITFSADSTFTVTSAKNSKTGKYSFDVDEKKINLEITGGKTMSASVISTSSSLSLLFNADKLIDVITFVSEKVPNSTLKTVATLVNSYDGMKVGLEFKK